MVCNIDAGTSPPSSTNFRPSDNDFVNFMPQATSSDIHLPSAPSPSEASAAKFASDIFDWGSDDTLADSSSATPYNDFQFLGSSDPVLPNVIQPLSTDLCFDYRCWGQMILGGWEMLGWSLGLESFGRV